MPTNEDKSEVHKSANKDITPTVKKDNYLRSDFNSYDHTKKAQVSSLHLVITLHRPSTGR